MIVQLGAVKPTGWAGYVFEGADVSGFLFTCGFCRHKFYVPPDDNPSAYHTCSVDAGPGYVNQDR